MIIAPVKNKLNATLGVAFGIAIGIGSVIGVGILRTPGAIAALVPNPLLIMLCWMLGGVYVLLGVGTYAELAAMLPKAGGSYNYIKRAFGNFSGFYAGWMDYIVNAIGPAYFCIVISEYLALLLPALGGYEKAVAIIILFLFTILHLVNVKTGSIIQQVMSLIKVIMFLSLVIALFIFSDNVEASLFNTAPIQTLATGGLLVGFFKAMQLVLGTYDGWMSACVFAEEDKNPGRNIPRSLFIGASIVIAIYLLVNASFLHVLPVDTLAKSPLPASDAALLIFGQSGATVVTIIAVVSLLSILNVYMMIPSRILFGLSRDGFFNAAFATVNKGGTPVYALLVSAALSCALIVIGSFGALFSLAAFLLLIVLLLTFSSLLALRKKEPELLRPYRSKGYPYTTYLLIACTAALFIGFAIADVKNMLIIVTLFIFSSILYYFLVKNKVEKK